MSSKTARIGVSAAVIVGALSFLLYQTIQVDAQYFKHVDEAMASPEDWYGKRMQLHGFVVDGSIQHRPDTLDWRFEVQHGGKVVRATYTGVVPDTFQPGSEVVLKGTLGPEGFHVVRDGVMAKCPSKYEADNAIIGSR